MVKLTRFLIMMLFLVPKGGIGSSCDMEMEDQETAYAFSPSGGMESLLYSTVRIETDKQIGTAFFYVFSDITRQEENPSELDQTYLITNRHMIEGATFVKTRFHLSEEQIIEGVGPKLQPLKQSVVRFLELNDWILDDEMDLAAFPMKDLIQNLKKEGQFLYYYPITNTQYIQPQDKRLTILQLLFMPGQNIYMIGYPNNFYDDVHNYPIIRKGIAASHPDVDFKGRPEFVIDAACFPGSSGSPVFYYNQDHPAL